MDKPVSRIAIENTPIHSYDTQTRRIICGAPGQIGSTKHARDVTCDECLGLLGRPSRSPLHLTVGDDSLASH
jgi:hypothetical protein